MCYAIFNIAKTQDSVYGPTTVTITLYAPQHLSVYCMLAPTTVK